MPRNLIVCLPQSRVEFDDLDAALRYFRKLDDSTIRYGILSPEDAVFEEDFRIGHTDCMLRTLALNQLCEFYFQHLWKLISRLISLDTDGYTADCRSAALIRHILNELAYLRFNQDYERKVYVAKSSTGNLANFSFLADEEEKSIDAIVPNTFVSLPTFRFINMIQDFIFYNKIPIKFLKCIAYPREHHIVYRTDDDSSDIIPIIRFRNHEGGLGTCFVSVGIMFDSYIFTCRVSGATRYKKHERGYVFYERPWRDGTIFKRLNVIVDRVRRSLDFPLRRDENRLRKLIDKTIRLTKDKLGYVLAELLYSESADTITLRHILRALYNANATHGDDVEAADNLNDVDKWYELITAFGND